MSHILGSTTPIIVPRVDTIITAILYKGKLRLKDTN